MTEKWQDFSIEALSVEELHNEKKYSELVLRDLKGTRIVFEGVFALETEGSRILVRALNTDPTSDEAEKEIISLL